MVRTLLKSLSLVLLLAAAVLFVLKLDPGKAERLAPREVAEAAALLVFGVGLAVLTYFAAGRSEPAPPRADVLDEAWDSIAAIRQSLEHVNRRLEALEAFARAAPAAVEPVVAAAMPEVVAPPTTSAPTVPSLASDVDAVEERDFAREREKIESLMSISRWDEALSAAERLAEEFAGRSEARLVLERVRRERAVYTEGLATRLYEQVKQASARKQWRRAYAAAKRLVDELSTHPRASKVRPTLDTLAANAEIEERQEREDEIQRLVRSQRLAEAIELSEQLVAEYPDSPQARSLRELIPKLRERMRVS